METGQELVADGCFTRAAGNRAPDAELRLLLPQRPVAFEVLKNMLSVLSWKAQTGCTFRAILTRKRSVAVANVVCLGK
jgi:hypothetical protein